MVVRESVEYESSCTVWWGLKKHKAKNTFRLVIESLVAIAAAGAAAAHTAFLVHE